MNERWRLVGDLFEAALERDPAQRTTWVRASGSPPDVQDEVLSLLAAHESSGTFLDEPALVTEPGQSLDTISDTSGRGGALAPPIAPGTDIGPYRIISLIGEGGMGVVYLAEDTRLHRQVALKSLPTRLARDERLRQRLRQEARAAAALAHPGIATVFALEELDDQVFIASEYLRGDTLRAEMDRGRLSQADVVQTALAIARAMAAAHERGIVHRDLKPENVLRTESGALKILDFGLAQFEAPARDLASWTRITEPGLVAGTPAYMAPEQLLARPTDARTDQFAFGVLVCELATGCHPFSGDSLPSTIARILTAEPQIPADGESLSDDLSVIVQRCLQKAPADRYASTATLVTALEQVAARLPGPSRNDSSGRGGASTSANASAFALRASADRSADRSATHTGGPKGPPLPGNVAARSAEIPREADAAWWWRFHQLAAAVVYWAMVWPAWHVRPRLGTPGLLWFLALLACVIVAGNLRLHLWFTSRIYPGELQAQRSSVGTWIRWADWGFVTLLLMGGLALVQAHAGWGALLVAVGVGTVVAFTIIEPTTARAAFGDRP